MTQRIEDLLLRLTDPVGPQGFLNAGYATIRADGRLDAVAVGRRTPDGSIPATDPNARLRMASISKAATARAVCALVVRGEMSLDATVTDALSWPARPAWLRQHPVTIRHLLNHTSGLTDAAGYLVDPGESLLQFIDANEKAVSGRQPGAYFAYANLNYVLLGHVMETVTRRRFDHILQDEVLTPAGIAGGFTWAGVPLPERANRLPLYQRGKDGLTVQADADDADWHADIIWRGGRGHSFRDYRLGRDTSLLSPHAGLRMNVVEAARLARFLGDASPAGQLQREVSWRYDPSAANGEDCDGLFTAFGLGLTIYESHPRIPGHLIGHAGHALGFTGGAWHNVDTGISHAYFLTGSRDETEGLDGEVFYGPGELALMQQF
ncbi:serine hydrolase domain-containing protein [Tabrizicola sp.]|uniref:serine hydrolase domain-containing protein n=1 Tax=Tabrizicola sp. TaxID=2005166 RepID=UPI003F37EB6D